MASSAADCNVMIAAARDDSIELPAGAVHKRVMPTHPQNIDDYIALFSPEVQAILKKIRSTIRQTEPEAQELISYRIPAFMFHGILVYSAAFKAHIGLYPPVGATRNWRSQSQPKRDQRAT